MEQPWGVALCSSMADKGSGRQLKGAPASLSLDHMWSIYRQFGSQRSKEKDSFYFKVIAYLQPEKLNIFCQDRFLVLGRVVIRECMAVEAGFWAFWANTWFSLENRIFLTVSNSCLILKNLFQAGIKPSGIFGAALGVARGSPAWQTKDLDASLKELLARFHWTTCEAYIDNLEARGPKRKTLFILRS